MKLPAPQIGFDRFIKLEWAEAALRVRAGVSNLDDLAKVLDASHHGTAAKKKTRTVLNRLWLEPLRSDLVEFADRGAKIYRDGPDISVPAMTWGMALATYPFLGKWQRSLAGSPLCKANAPPLKSTEEWLKSMENARERAA